MSVLSGIQPGDELPIGSRLGGNLQQGFTTRQVSLHLRSGGSTYSPDGLKMTVQSRPFIFA